MDINSSNIIKQTAASITQTYKSNELLFNERAEHMPSRAAIIDLLKNIRCVLFPGYYNDDIILGTMPDYFVGNTLANIYNGLKEQIELALLYKKDDGVTFEQTAERADSICAEFFNKLPDIQNMLLKDVQAAFDGDPAAKSKEEVIFSYPGFFATYVYRIAHIFYENNVPFIPRIMTEYAHTKTGIDINSGAKIGEYFFIDHGTGIVIGETCEIGDYVKIYQGVTLGALSTRSGQLLAGVKRHPTICNNVTIYSGATILGGETVIGDNAIIGGNSFITESIPAYTKVSIKNPELILKYPKCLNKDTQDGCWEI